MKDDLLAGNEWGYVISVLGTPISTLKSLVTNEESYLEAMASDQTVEVKKRIQNRFFVEQVREIFCCCTEISVILDVKVYYILSEDSYLLDE